MMALILFTAAITIGIVSQLEKNKTDIKQPENTNEKSTAGGSVLFGIDTENLDHKQNKNDLTESKEKIEKELPELPDPPKDDF